MGEGFGVTRLQEHASRPVEVEDPALTGLHSIDWIVTTLHSSAHLELQVQGIGNDVAGVDRDDLVLLEVDHVDRAIDAAQRLPLPRGAEAETAFATEQVGHAAPLSVDLDTRGVSDPASPT